MSARPWLIGAAAAALTAAGVCGYHALGDWLTRQMTGKVKPPRTATTPAAPPTRPEDGYPAKLPESLSGLDLIRKSAAGGPVPGTALSRQQLETVRQAGLDLVDSLKPLLKDPAMTSRLSPEQAKQYQQLMAILDQAEKTAKSNAPLDMRQMAAEVQKAQQLSLQLMSQFSQSPPSAAGGGKAPH